MLTLIVLGTLLILGVTPLIKLAEEQYQSYIFWGA